MSGSSSDEESSSDDSSIEIDSQPSTELRKMTVNVLKERLKAKGLPYTAKYSTAQIAAKNLYSRFCSNTRQANTAHILQDLY